MSLGKTVAELRAGKPMPLSYAEFVEWRVWHMDQQEREKEQAKQHG